jgi:hypothetical protein
MVHLTTLAVFDTRLGSEDESASLDERAERVLYFHPSDTDKESQLFLIDSCLSMNSLASMFTDSACDTVYFQDQTLSITECEPGLFFVAGFSHDDSLMPSSTSSSYRYATRLSAMANALTPSLPTSSTNNSTTNNASTSGAVSAGPIPSIVKGSAPATDADTAASSAPVDDDNDGIPRLNGEVHAQLARGLLTQLYEQARLFLGCITQRIHSGASTQRLKVVRRLLRKAEQLKTDLRDGGASEPTEDQVKALLQVPSLENEVSVFD